jgi:hypothetical protein
LSKFSLTGRRSLAILPGLGIGILTGLLLVVSHNRQVVAPANSNPVLKLSEVEQLSPAELETLTLKALSTLRKKSGFVSHHGFEAEEDAVAQSINNRQHVHLGIKNVRRLLPLAKRLTLESLREAEVGDTLKASGLSREERLINGVHRIVLDESLSDMAEVREGRLSEIRIGSGYALYLVSDDEAIFLLGHELMHVAARTGRLKPFIEHVTETARLSANVQTTEDQREDLACEFTGAQALRRFIALYPTAETEAVRFSRVLGYQTPAERLARVWEDLCAPDNDDAGDEEHLSQQQTMRALLGLDPSLKLLLPEDAVSALCH